MRGYVRGYEGVCTRVRGYEGMRVRGYEGICTRVQGSKKRRGGVPGTRE